MPPSLRVGLVLLLFALGGARVAGTQEALTKRDRQGSVTVAVTLAAPPAIGVPIRAKIVLDTHSVALDGVAFDQAVTLRTADGVDMAPTGGEVLRES